MMTPPVRAHRFHSALGSAVLAAIAGCSDYNVNSKAEPVDGAEPADSGLPDADDSATPDDTDDSGIPGGSDTTEPDDPALATATNYIHTSDQLFAWEPGTGATAIAPFRDSSGSSVEITDLAIDLDGRMFAVGWSTLYTVDASTARVSRVADMDQSLVGLTFLSDGRLIGAGDGIFEVDTTTGALRALTSGGGYTTSGDVVGMPDGKLYWTVLGSFGDALVRIDPTTWSTTYVGEIGESSLWGIGEVGGNLTGFSSGGRLVEIDPTTARVSRSTTLPNAWWGATTNPVRW